MKLLKMDAKSNSMKLILNTVVIQCTPHPLIHSREVPESCLIGHEWYRCPIFLPVSGFGQVDLLKLERVLGLQNNVSG